MTTTKDLFCNLLWPAAAGNVAWTFVYLAVDKGITAPVRPQLAVLGLLGVYLGYEWWRANDRSDVWWTYWLLDGLFIGAVVVFAIATYLAHPVQEGALSFILGVAVTGHLVGAWMDKQKKSFKERWVATWRSRAKLALANGSGLLLLVLPVCFCIGQHSYELPLVMGVVLVLWYVCRRQIAAEDGV